MKRCRVPGDKSIAHRALMLAPFASGRSVLRGLPEGRDVRSTEAAMRALGAGLSRLADGALAVEGGLTPMRPASSIDCGNSGTTARLLTGLLAGLGLPGELDGDASLRSRPMDRVVYPLQAMGAAISYVDERGRLPVRLAGRATGALRPFRHRARVASSQVKSAILLAGLTARVRVEIIEPGRSRDHTERMLSWMGAPVESGVEDGARRVSLDPEGWDGRLRPLDIEVPGDLSSAAFLIVAALLSGRGLTVDRVGLNPTRTGVLEVLKEAGADIHIEPGGTEAGEEWGAVSAEPGPYRPIRVGADLVPRLIDEIPVLAVFASRIPGVSLIEGADELRHKESDRLAAIQRNLVRLGVDCSRTDDGLRIRGTESPLSGTVETADDHRIAMAFGVLSMLPEMRINIEAPESVDVSFPDYWEQLASIVPEAGSGPARVTGGADEASGPVDSFAIAIDGPAASGKSTTARQVADALGALHLSSGSLYRAIAWVSLAEGWIDADDFSRRLAELPLTLVAERDGFVVRVRGTSPGAALDDPEVVARVSEVSARRAVRERVTEAVRQAAAGQRVVSDGRDVGTTVFPDAALKVFLTASPEERARRRLLDYEREPSPEAIANEAATLQARDTADSTRELSPLRRASDAIDIDTTRLSPSEVVERIVELAVARGLGS